MCQIDQFWRVFALAQNTWYYIIVCKLFVLKVVTWSYDCLQRIIIISYLKPYNCLQIIGVEYLKLYNCMQTNDYYYQIGIVTLNHILVYKLFDKENNKFCLYNSSNRNAKYLADFFHSRTVFHD